MTFTLQRALAVCVSPYGLLNELGTKTREFCVRDCNGYRSQKDDLAHLITSAA